MFVRFEDHTPPLVIFVSVVVSFLQTVNVPPIFSTFGTANTFTIFVAAAEQLVCEFVKL